MKSGLPEKRRNFQKFQNFFFDSPQPTRLKKQNVPIVHCHRSHSVFDCYIRYSTIMYQLYLYTHDIGEPRRLYNIFYLKFSLFLLNCLLQNFRLQTLKIVTYSYDVLVKIMVWVWVCTLEIFSQLIFFYFSTIS